jgi:hypothetical protein
MGESPTHWPHGSGRPLRRNRSGPPSLLAQAKVATNVAARARRRCTSAPRWTDRTRRVPMYVVVASRDERSLPRAGVSSAPATGDRISSAAGASRTGTWALAHGRKRPRGVVHAALSRARVQPSETLVVERKQVVTAELVRRSRLVQRGMPRRLARGWCLRARRRSPVPAGSRWRRAVASPRARPSAADEGGRPLPAALHFSSYTAQKALMRP